MAGKTELVEYKNKWGTEVTRHSPIHHRVNSKVAGKELARAKDILKIDKSMIRHAERQLHKAIGKRERG